MKVKFLLLVVMMCVGLTACSQSTTSDEDGGYTDEQIERIHERAEEGVHLGDDKTHIIIEDCKYFCD